jgi:hypothetical protein
VSDVLHKAAMRYGFSAVSGVFDAAAREVGGIPSEAVAKVATD